MSSDRRIKMISLRLSEAEYEMLKKRYRTFGARNVSDLARLALQRILAGSDTYQDDFAAALAELNNRVNVLESERQGIAVSGPAPSTSSN